MHLGWRLGVFQGGGWSWILPRLQGKAFLFFLFLKFHEYFFNTCITQPGQIQHISTLDTYLETVNYDGVVYGYLKRGKM